MEKKRELTTDEIRRLPLVYQGGHHSVYCDGRRIHYHVLDDGSNCREGRCWCRYPARPATLAATD